jgi:hypothetical protein
VAPVSYFFCASAPLLDTVSRVSATDATANLLAVVSINSLPRFNDNNDLCRGFLDVKALLTHA